MDGGAIRGQPDPPAGGRLPDARLADEAEDAVQEAWQRLSRSRTSGVENLGGWLTTVVARVCLDMLRSRKARREEALSAQVSGATVSRENGFDPEHEALLADSVGLALLVVLERLAPAERVAVVLHDMFDLPFDEIAPTWDAPPPPQGTSRAAPGAVCGERPFPKPISPAGERLSRPSLPHRAEVSSTRLSRCSTLRSCCEPTALPCKWVHRERSAVRQPWPAYSPGVCPSHERRADHSQLAVDDGGDAREDRDPFR